MKWSFIDSGPNAASRNMAVDEELLARAQAGEQTPVLRFYQWDPPAVTIGRFQDQETAVKAGACNERGFDIVRRISGGRAVLHHHELTYTVVSRTDNSLFPPGILGTYKIIASCLLEGFRILGIPAEMVSRNGRYASLVEKHAKAPACFSSPSWYEIVVRGKKIVGSAQHRLTHAFLQHGSILIAYDPALEAAVIPGSDGSAVTSITEELGRQVPIEEIKKAFFEGFATVFDIGPS